MLYRLPRFSIATAIPVPAAFIRVILDDVGKCPFCLSEIPDPRSDQHRDIDNGDRHCRPESIASGSQYAPPETVDNPNHRIERIQRLETCRYNAALKAHRRNIQA